jgi:hypothetical protein
MKHAKPAISKPNVRVVFVAALALAFIIALMSAFNAKANDSTTPPTQQTLGRSEQCTVNVSSACTVNHGLGVKPTSIVVTPGGPGQNATVDPSKTTDTSYTVKFLWHDGTKFKSGIVIKYYVVYTYVGAPIEPSPSPTVTSSTPSPTETNTPTPTTTVTPTASPTIPADKSCSPTNTIAHFTGEGSDAIGDGYDISAEQWAVKNDYSSNLCAYSKDDWYVEIKATDHGDGAVQAYPSIRKIYHDWGGPEDYTLDPKLSSFPQLKVEFAHQSPTDCAGCVYEEAFDIWLNGIGDGNYQTELMIWTHNQGQSPYGDLKAKNVTVDGRQWDVYYGAPDYVAYVPADGAPQAITSGTIDVKAFAKDMANRGIMRTAASDPHVGQISYGVEPVDTKGVFKRWDFTKFNVLDK